MSTGYWLGVDLGGTKILSGLFDDDLKLLARSKQPTSAEGGPAAVFGRIVQGVEAVIKEAKVEPAADSRHGHRHPRADRTRHDDACGSPRTSTGATSTCKPLLPAAWRWPLVVENDVRMGTYGEFAHGAAKGARHVLGVFVGTGVGGGLILNGELFTGFNGNAGEIGHLIVHWRQGTELESIAGRKYMMKRAKEILDDAPEAGPQGVEGRSISPGVRSSQLAEYLPEGRPGRGATRGRRGPGARGGDRRRGELPQPGSDRDRRRRDRGARRHVHRAHLGDRPAVHAARCGGAASGASRPRSATTPASSAAPPTPRPTRPAVAASVA